MQPTKPLTLLRKLDAVECALKEFERQRSELRLFGLRLSGEKFSLAHILQATPCWFAWPKIEISTSGTFWHIFIMIPSCTTTRSMSRLDSTMSDSLLFVCAANLIELYRHRGAYKTKANIFADTEKILSSIVNRYTPCQCNPTHTTSSSWFFVSSSATRAWCWAENMQVSTNPA